jgi:chitodextrinase
VPRTRKAGLLHRREPFQFYQMAALLLLVVAIGAYVVSRIFAASGVLYLAPASSTTALGSTFTVTVHENSGSDAVNAVEADLTYPTNLLQFVSSDGSTSPFTVQAANTGGNGTVTLSRGNQTALTGDQVVAVLTFKTLAVGQASIAFASSSALVRASDQTNVLVTTTPGIYTVADEEPPSVPMGVAMSANTVTTIDVSWTASTDDVGVTGYKVYRNGTQVGTSTTTTYHDTGLVPGTAYTYTVSAYDAAGNNSAQSAASSFSTLPDTTPPTVPGTPSLSSRTMTSISLGWTASTDNVAVTGYKVFRNGTQVGTVATAAYTSTGLAPGTSYSFAVAAYDAAGNTSAQSTAASQSTLPDTQPPTVPTGLTAVATGQNVQLSWTAASDNVAVTGYVVYRGGTQVATVTGLTYTDSNLALGSYSYTVAAYDAAGNTSPQSTAASITVYKAGDINHDGKVNVYDLSTLLSNWGKTGTNTSDLNGDGVVNIIDLSIMLSAWTG